MTTAYYPRPRQPRFNPYHPSARNVIQCYLTSNPGLSGQYELVSNQSLPLQPSSSASYSFVSDPTTNGTVLLLNETGSGVESLTLPFSNKWTNTTTTSFTCLMRIMPVSFPVTANVVEIANNSGGDGAFLKNNNATTVYSFIFGNQTPNLTVDFNKWETYGLRWTSGGLAEIMAFNDDGIRLRNLSVGATSGAMSFAGTTQSFAGVNGGNYKTYFDFFIDFARYVSDAEIGWFLRNR